MTSTSTGKPGRDPIKDLLPSGSDPAAAIVAPVNPRSIWSQSAAAYASPAPAQLLDTLLKMNTAVGAVQKDLTARLQKDREAYKQQQLTAMISQGMLRKMQALQGKAGIFDEQIALNQTARDRLRQAIDQGTLNYEPNDGPGLAQLALGAAGGIALAKLISNLMR